MTTWGSDYNKYMERMLEQPASTKETYENHLASIYSDKTIVVIVRRSHNLANGMRRNDLDELGRLSVAIGILLSRIRVFSGN
jgi:hypothetical protein